MCGLQQNGGKTLAAPGRGGGDALSSMMKSLSVGTTATPLGSQFDPLKPQNRSAAPTATAAAPLAATPVPPEPLAYGVDAPAQSKPGLMEVRPRTDPIGRTRFAGGDLNLGKRDGKLGQGDLTKMGFMESLASGNVRPMSFDWGGDTYGGIRDTPGGYDNGQPLPGSLKIAAPYVPSPYGGLTSGVERQYLNRYLSEDDMLTALMQMYTAQPVSGAAISAHNQQLRADGAAARQNRPPQARA